LPHTISPDFYSGAADTVRKEKVKKRKEKERKEKKRKGKERKRYQILRIVLEGSY